MANQTQAEAGYPPPSATAQIRPSDGGTTRFLVPVLLLLLVIVGVVWMTRPKPVAVYSPPPAPKKTVAQAQAQIDAMKSNKKIPEQQKGRILGFMQAELEQAKARENGASVLPTK